MNVDVDFGLCESNGICVGLNSDVFELGDDDQLIVHDPEVTPANESSLHDAVRQCPRQAISFRG